MKIAMLIWAYWPGLQGGSERQARLVARELISRGHECEIFTAWTSLSWSRSADDNGCKIHRLGIFVPALLVTRDLVAKCIELFSPLNAKKGKNRSGGKESIKFWLMAPLTWLARLDFILEFLFLSWTGRVKCEIIHLHEPLWLGGVAQWASQWIGCAVVCQEATSPALPIIGYDTPFRGRLARLRKKPFYIGMAEYTIEQLLGRGIRYERIYHLPSGVKVPPEPSQGMKSLNVFYVANFSQGAAWKAFDILFDAWVLIARRLPQARLCAVGGGDSEEWKTFLVEEGVADTVVFTGTVQSIDEYFSRSSVFLLPSRVEGMSNALLEAQMWGLACVVSDIPGNRAVVTHGVNGLIVPVGQAEALADAVVCLLGDEDLRCRLGKVARENAINNFGIHSVVEQLIPIYQEIISKEIE